MSSGAYRFRPWQRLRSRADFNRPRKLGFTADCAGFLCRFLPPANQLTRPTRRLGVIASRKVGNAVVRNRAKRHFREIFRKNQDALPQAVDVIIIVRKAFEKYAPKELEARYLKACGRYQMHLQQENEKSLTEVQRHGGEEPQ